MRPLTHQVWEEHFVALRPHVLQRFPAVHRQELEALDDDYDGLVALVERSQHFDADRALREVQGLDVDALKIGTGEATTEEEGAKLATCLSVGTGFREDERERIIDRLSQLDRRLKRFNGDSTYLELSVKDRETPSQVVTLETEVPGFERIIAQSKEDDLRAALADVRDDTITQIEKAVDKRSRGGR